MSIIKLENVEKIYRTKEIETIALQNVNIAIEAGEFVSIMGPSGCGKSTLLNLIGLLDTPTSGRIEINNQSTVNLSDSRLSALRNENIGFIFQSFHLIPSLNVMQNVRLPLSYRSGESSGAANERVREVLTNLGLGHRLRHLPSQLSGGQCQRVAIARAIVGRPQILLADEPTGNLDSHTGAEVMQLLHTLNREEGMTVVMVTHNESHALQTDRIIRFFDGRQVE